MNEIVTPRAAPSPIPSSEIPERRARAREAGSMGAILRRWLYSVKYRPFRRERRPFDGRRGLIVLQIDALPYAELRRAIELGYCPTISGMVREEGYDLRRWFSGLPAATPYSQAGILHGENDGIPAFRFYDKRLGRVVTCNTPAGVQYIRDRIHAPGALAGGSSYVNLLDGDAQTVAFTVATRERTSVYRRLGGTRMALLVALHPVRVLRMVFQSGLEWLREEWDRGTGELARRRTFSEGLFPFVRILTNVIVRELQTMAITLDIYLGVPVIYSTFMQYDELAHHFGPSSWQALRDLRRTDKRIREIRRMIRSAAGREYDLVILSDHGMTPSASYRVQFGETLGTTVARILDADAAVRPAGGRGAAPLRSREISGQRTDYGQSTEYAGMAPQVVGTMAEVTAEWRTAHRALGRFRDWLRRRYGLQGLLVPQKYLVEEKHDVVVTYSSCLALLYFDDEPGRLEHSDVLREPRRAHLYASLLAHPGIGVIATLSGTDVHVESSAGHAVVRDGTLEIVRGANPLERYGTETVLLRAIEHLVRQPNAGDLVLFGAYDGYEIVSFDDQIGAHGSPGGNQVWPFIVAPAEWGLAAEAIEDARDLYRFVMMRDRHSQTMAEGSGYRDIVDEQSQKMP